MWWGIGIFSFALALRLVHLVQILPAPFFPFKMGDAASYDAWAQQIAAGHWLGSEVFYQAPLYPYFLAVIYRLVGSDMFSIRLCQAVVGASSSVLLTGAGWRIFSKPVGILAGLLLATYAPALFFDSLVQKSVLDALFLCLLLNLYSRLLDHPVAWLWCALGASLGGLILTRENALVLVPAVLISLVSYTTMSHRVKLGASLWFLAGVGLILLPVAMRNAVVGGEFHLTTSQSGPNFYIGNNPRANGTYRPLRPRRGSAKHERRDARELAEQALGRELTPAEVSDYWSTQAFQFIRQDTGAWLKLMGRKFLYLCNAMELVDTEDQYTYAEWSWLLRFGGYVLHMGILMPLAAWGVWCTWPSRRRLVLLYLIIGFYSASVIAFYVVGRYRYPLVPILSLFAAAGVVETRRFLTQSSRGRVIVALVCCLSVALFCNIPIKSRGEMRATTHYNVGVELDAVELHEAAIGEYLATLRLDAGFDAVHNNLGCDYLYTGQLDAAIEHLERAVVLDPSFVEAVYNLATAYLAKGDHQRAVTCFERLVQLRPKMPRAYLGLGMAQQRLGNTDAARAALQKALAIDPDYEEAQQALEELGT